MSRPVNIFHHALSGKATEEEVKEALRTGACLLEQVSSYRNNQRTIEDSGLMDNYTDAARSRKRLVEITEEFDGLIKASWKWVKEGEN